jgi:hypothetical protein
MVKRTPWYWSFLIIRKLCFCLLFSCCPLLLGKMVELEFMGSPHFIFEDCGAEVSCRWRPASLISASSDPALEVQKHFLKARFGSPYQFLERVCYLLAA